MSAILLHCTSFEQLNFCSTVLALNAIREVFYSWFVVPQETSSIYPFCLISCVLLLGGLTTTHYLVPSRHHQLIYHTLFSCEYSLLILLFRDMCPVVAVWWSLISVNLHFFSGICPTIIWVVQSQGPWQGHSSKAIAFCSSVLYHQNYHFQWNVFTIKLLVISKQIFIPLSCSIVGNPLICTATMEQDCYGSLPMPMSYSLNNTQGMQS